MPKVLKINIDKSLLGKRVPFIRYIYAGIIANLVIVLALLAIRSFLPPQIPIFYGAAEGERQLAPSWALIIPNLASTLASLVNIALCLLIKDEFLKKTLVIASLGISLLATITVAKIILIVGSFNI